MYILLNNIIYKLSITELCSFITLLAIVFSNPFFQVGLVQRKCLEFLSVCCCKINLMTKAIEMYLS